MTMYLQQRTHFPVLLCQFHCRLCDNAAGYRAVQEPHLLSCIFKHAYTHKPVALWMPAWLLVKRSVLKPWTRGLFASRAGEFQSGAREAPLCLQRSKASFYTALFTFCSLQQLNCTQKRPFLPVLCPYCFCFSLPLTWLPSDSWFNPCVRKGNYVLNWIIGSFPQMSAHPPTQHQIQNSPQGWAVKCSLLDQHHII